MQIMLFFVTVYSIIILSYWFSAKKPMNFLKNLKYSAFNILLLLNHKKLICGYFLKKVIRI
jgi:hypothetical protein